MARRGGGKDPILLVLEQIRDQAKLTNARLNKIEAEQKKTNSRLDKLNTRFESLAKFAGERYRRQDDAIKELRDRVMRLEDRL